MADEPQQAEHVNVAHQAIPVAIQPMPEFKPEAHVGASLATSIGVWGGGGRRGTCPPPVRPETLISRAIST